MRLIDADALIDRLDYCVKEGMGSTIAFTFKHMVEDAPTIEPRRGEWIIPDDDESIVITGRCSACGWESHLLEDDVVGMPFCPNCGARMKGADDE